MDYTALKTGEHIDDAVAALRKNGFEPETFPTGSDALARIIELIPKGASVMNGASKTLEKIGYVDYLKKEDHGWNNLHAAILEETDAAKKADLRKAGVLSDYYLGSVHAATEDGRLVIASNTGSQLPHLAFTSPNLVLVVSTKKIVPDLSAALDRIETHILPLEDNNMKEKYGPQSGTLWAKTLILNKENPSMGRHVHVLFVAEDLGF